MIGDEVMMANIHVRVTDKEKNAFKQKCESLGTDMSKAIKKFIIYYIEHKQKR